MKKKYRILIILFMLILMIMGFGLTYSIFHSSTSLTSVDQGLAKFIFNTESLDQLQLSLVDFNPGDNKEYPFSIGNNSEGTLSNVTVQYQMTIKTYHLIPLIINLYKVNGEVEELIFTCDETSTRNPQNELICNAPIQEMGHAAEQLDNYKLKVQFPSEYSGSEYSNLVDYINIQIKSWQKIDD